LGWVVCECYALLDVALQAVHTGLEEGLLAIIEVGEWVVGFLCTVGLLICQYI
jgi:hypothetical protein